MVVALLVAGAGLVAALVGLAAAAIVLLVDPRRAQNRWLATYLLLLGAPNFAVAVGAALGTRASMYNGYLEADALQAAAVCVYLGFLGTTLRTPWVAPLRHPVGRALLALAACGFASLPFLAPLSFFRAPSAYATTWGWSFASGPGNDAYNLATVAVFLFGLLVAVDAFRRAAKGSATRSSAGAFLLAFGANALAIVVAVTVGTAPGVPPDVIRGALLVAIPLASVAFVALLARGLLRHQLFDFELRVKWTLHRGVLVAIFLAVFFVASAIAEQFLQQYGYLVGGVAIGLLLFALRPVERFAERLTQTAMPHVDASPGYVQFKKFEVYRAAVESAAETGGIDARERIMLERLREKLGLATADAAALEAEIAAA